jgi:hypothetical protein
MKQYSKILVCFISLLLFSLISCSESETIKGELCFKLVSFKSNKRFS